MSGVYFLIWRGIIVYIGQTIDIKRRMKEYSKSAKFDSMRFIKCNPDKLRYYERRLIRIFQPEFNVQLNPTKKYDRAIMRKTALEERTCRMTVIIRGKAK